VIRSRKEAIPPDLRILFFMIDGVTPAAEILGQLSGLGVGPEAFDRLHAAGYIVPLAPLLSTQAPAAVAAYSPAETERRPEPPPFPGRVSAQNVETDRFMSARTFLNETVVNAVGLRSFLFTLKLEKANSLKDLRNLIVDYARLIEKGTGKLEAEVLTRRARELTSEDPRTRRPDAPRT
jgi:hypothetical protein